MLQETLKTEIVAAVKSGQEIKRDILKLTLSEAQRLNKYDDQSLINIIKKLIESNNEILKYGHDVKLVKENEILKRFLPATLSKEQIKEKLRPIHPALLSAKGGQSIGIALKYLRGEGLSFNNSDIKEIIEELCNQQ